MIVSLRSVVARCLLALLVLVGVSAARAEERVWTFNVLNQRSITLTLEYWNPILKYVSEKSGIKLELRMARSAPESSAAIGRGEYDFVYSNHIFAPANAPAGYRVFAQPKAEAIRGEIVTLENSSIQTLKDLQGLEVGFPSPAAFVGYAVPMNALLQEGISVKPVFAGNQEGIMGQLKAGRVVAAGVNSRVMSNYARRENVQYRVLWRSEEYLNLPLAAHPRVPGPVVAAVRQAVIGMDKDSEGKKILESSAALIRQKPPYGFVAADDKEYDNYRDYYKNTLVKGL